MDISIKAKERFCKDCSIPIKVYHDPYFPDRLELFDPFYGSISKWYRFVRELRKYNCEQDYFEECSKIRTAAIDSIKNTEAYEIFDAADFSDYVSWKDNIPEDAIFKKENVGKTYISIDMKKANFSALQKFDPDIFSGAKTWEEFIGRFTNNEHIINSKYIRQSILGTCNPKRQATFEKKLMSDVQNRLDEDYHIRDSIIGMNKDEIILDVSSVNDKEFFANKIRDMLNDSKVPLRVELFKLHGIKGIPGYYKEIFDGDQTEIKFTGVNSYHMPMVVRRFLGEEIMESDMVFYQDGMLAKYLDVPDFEFTDTAADFEESVSVVTSNVF